MEEIEKILRSALSVEIKPWDQRPDDAIGWLLPDRDEVFFIGNIDKTAAAIQAHYAVLLAEKDKEIAELKQDKQRLTNVAIRLLELMTPYMSYSLKDEFNAQLAILKYNNEQANQRPTP